MRIIMNQKTTLFLWFIAYFNVAKSNVIAPNNFSLTSTSTSPDSKSQRIKVTIHNSVDSILELQSSTLHWGSWNVEPKSIGALSGAFYTNYGSTFAGPENDVVYKYKNYGKYGTFKIYTNIDHWGGSFTERMEYSEDFGKFFNIKKNVDSVRSQYELIISLEVKVPDNFNVFISGDPQPYRLFDQNNDPNEDKDLWENRNKGNADKIIEKNWSKNFHFGIINGDLTEYGRKAQRESFEKVFANRFPFNLYLGLGNHDYQNNINDCWDVGHPNLNGCAAGSVQYMEGKLKEYSLILNNFNYHFDNIYTGSMAYRFDYGNYTFFQLQNYPSYEVTFSSIITFKIRSSLQWLRQELGKTNKNIVLCLHDMRRYLSNEDSNTNIFKGIVNDFKIKLIFAGHTHNYGKNHFGTATAFSNYALFDGGFFTVNFKDNCASVYKHNDEYYEKVCF